MVWDVDFRCSRDYYLSNSIALKVQIQKITAKDFYPKKPKIKEVKPILSQVIEVNKSSKQVHKKKNRKSTRKGKIRKNRLKLALPSLLKFKRKKKNWYYNFNEAMYYNCKKKSYYANIYIKPKKLVLILISSVPMTNSGKEIVKVFCIYYLI